MSGGQAAAASSRQMVSPRHPSTGRVSIQQPRRRQSQVSNSVKKNAPVHSLLRMSTSGHGSPLGP